MMVFQRCRESGIRAPALLGKHLRKNEVIMDELLLLGLLFCIYWHSVVMHCETFEDIPLRNVTDRQFRWFLVLRRSRVHFSHILLIVCCVRVLFKYVVEPVVNLFFRFYDPGMRMNFVLASEKELWILSIICIILTILIGIERIMLKKLVRRYGEEYEDSE